ncbi:RING finger protein 24-like isoform X2 [Nelusetta ayraudi]|uniref:RING finger protein 24-like isoform X2 n=1 Tax=Nelusetta ayraudi TaxID=303726 RepID=UPI003F6E8850
MTITPGMLRAMMEPTLVAEPSGECLPGCLDDAASGSPLPAAPSPVREDSQWRRQGIAEPSSMSSHEIFHLPLNVYIIILGIGLFVLMLSLIFCCYLFRLRRRGGREQYGYSEVVLKGAGKKLSLLGTCAVCLEEFRSRDELGVCPCSHAFHKKCLLKWLEIRSVCPMCNKPICRLQPGGAAAAAAAAAPEPPQNPQEV